MRGARVVEQRGGELLALRTQLLVLRLELVLQRRQPPQLPRQLERRQDGILRQTMCSLISSELIPESKILSGDLFF